MVQGQGTVKPHPSFNVEEDCKILRKAMKGFGRRAGCLSLFIRWNV